MGKPFTVQVAERNLRECHDAGIRTSINTVVGFPGETEEDFQATLGFLFRNHNDIDAINLLNTCMIFSKTDLAETPEEFNLEVDQVALIPDYFGVKHWVDDQGLDMEARQERLDRFSDVMVRLGISMDNEPIPPTWTRRQEAMEDVDLWRWLDALGDGDGATSYPLNTVLTLAFEHPKARIRVGAARMVKMLKTTAFNEHLHKGLHDADDRVKEMCARALGHQGNDRHLANLTPLLHNYDGCSPQMQDDLRPLMEIFRSRLPEEG